MEDKKENAPLRVLCVFGSLDQGGAESMCMNLYRHIDRSKVQFDFVSHSGPGGAFEEEIRTLGGKIYYCPRYKISNDLTYRKWWRRHLSAHPEHRIIHGHYFSVSSVFFSVAHQFGCITIGHSHTDSFANPLKRIFIKGVEKESDYCFACSEKAGKMLFPHKEFVVLRNAIDIQRFTYNESIASEVREEFSLGNTFVLGTVGTIKEVKNPLGMIEIFREVSKYKPDSKLLWVGRDEGMQKDAETRLKELGLVDRVFFTGPRSDVNRLMQAMDCFLLPSLSEGIPVVLIEAQAAGLACYASEAVSRETNITGLCHYLPLNEWPIWAENIVQESGNRQDMESVISAAGYDIHESAAWLQDFYLGIR